MLAAGAALLSIGGEEIELESPRMVRKRDIWPLLKRWSKNPSDAQNAELALQVDKAIGSTKKAGWHGSRIKEREVRLAIRGVLGEDDELVDAIFAIVKRQRDY